jgi:hypothetical protein
MGKLTRIEIGPAILTGKPIIRNTRIPVELIVKLVAQRWTDEQIIKASAPVSGSPHGIMPAFLPELGS